MGLERASRASFPAKLPRVMGKLDKHIPNVGKTAEWVLTCLLV